MSDRGGADYRRGIKDGRALSRAELVRELLDWEPLFLIVPDRQLVQFRRTLRTWADIDRRENPDRYNAVNVLHKAIEHCARVAENSTTKRDHRGRRRSLTRTTIADRIRALKEHYYG